jgi:hypothetical protein
MPILSALSFWDLALLVAVTAMGTLLAYVPDARWKAFIVGLPIPFTIATLSLGLPIGPSHALGLVGLLLFVNLVRWLHYGARLPIVPAILVSDCAYLALALLINRSLPDSAPAFWASVAAVVSAGALLLLFLPEVAEAASRSPLRPAVKVAAIFAVILVIVLLKRALRGFMTLFPMVTTVAAYEARKSLHTLGRQIPVVMVTIGPMTAAMWLAQRLLHASVPLSLLAGWAAFLAVLVPMTMLRMRRKPGAFIRQ